MKMTSFCTLIFIGFLSSAIAAETREYTGDINDLQFIDALGQGHIFTADSLQNTSGNRISVNFVPTSIFDQEIPRAVLGAFSVDADLSYNQVIFNQGAASPGVDWLVDNIPTLYEGSVFGAFSINGQVIENTLVINNSVFNLEDVFGGYSRHGLAQGNELILDGGRVFQLAGGRSITGDAVNNSVIINQGIVGHGAFGGTTGFGSAIGNTVYVSSDYGGRIAYIAGGESSVSSLNNSIEIHGGIYKKAIGGASIGLASGNTVSIHGGDFIGTSSPALIVGGLSDLGASTYNTVHVFGGDGSGAVVYGGSGVDYVFGNKVEINTNTLHGSFGASIIGGYSAHSAQVFNNSVTISNSSVGAVYGGFSDGGEVKNNDVSIERSSVVGPVTGGYSITGYVGFNQVDVFAPGHTLSGNVSGGIGNQADNNLVDIYDAVIEGNIYGGYGASTKGNIVNFYDGRTFSSIMRTNNGSIIGGLAEGDVSSDNQVNIYSGSVNGSVYGGQAQSYLSNNIVKIAGGSVQESASAAILTTDGGEATENQLILSGGVMRRNIIGVYGEDDSFVHKNRVEISGGHVSGDVSVAEVGANSQVTNNELIITGGIIRGNVYIAKEIDDSVFYPSNNKIMLGGDVAIHGQLTDPSGANTQLIFNNFRGNIHGGIDNNFSTFEFIVSKKAEDITPITPVDLADRHIKLHSVAHDEYFQVGDVSVLLANASNTSSTNDFLGSSIPSGATLIYDFERVDSSDSLAVRVSDIRTQPHLKALSESQLGALAFLNQNSDQLSMAARSLSDRSKNSDKKWLKFTEVSGGSSRYQTGSHVDVSGASLLTGVAHRIGKSSLLGMFAEGGWSSYNTVNPMESAPDVRSDGHVNFLGGGLIARHDFKKGMYMDAALRLGQVSTQFDSADISYNAGPTSFQTKALYYGAMLGFGHRWNLGDSFVLDTSGHQMWNRQAGNRVNVAGDPKPVDLHAIESHRLRGQVRIDYQGSLLSPYLSLAYEHEFQGQAHASVNGFSVPAPSLQGGTGVGGLGVKIQRSSGKSFVHAGVQGFVGKRQGFALMMNAGMVF